MSKLKCDSCGDEYDESEVEFHACIVCGKVFICGDCVDRRCCGSLYGFNGYECADCLTDAFDRSLDALRGGCEL
jgi:hypothetical protein